MVQKKEIPKNLDNDIKDSTQEELISYNGLVLKNQELEIKVNELRNQMLQFQEDIIILNSNMNRMDEYLRIAASDTLDEGEEVTATAMPPVKEQ